MSNKERRTELRNNPDTSWNRHLLICMFGDNTTRDRPSNSWNWGNKIDIINSDCSFEDMGLGKRGNHWNPHSLNTFLNIHYPI